MHCQVAFLLWTKLFREAGVSWENPAGSPALFYNFIAFLARGKKAKVLWGCSVLAVAVIWLLWMERYRRVYIRTAVEELWERVIY